MTLLFSPSRSAGLDRLHSFIPRAGAHYASVRNYDHGPDDRSNISVLSPYIRHRLILEQEVVEAVLKRHRFNAASKFIQEVCWRTYWKGWLETRPTVWTRYCERVKELREHLAADRDLGLKYEAAISGRTGIASFDAWVNELLALGYLHNHARMWFASVWIFTLGLPWELGADFFLRHLYDGDPASNTLSWRWVGGLHTKGKTYLARPGNIDTYTGGRFPSGPGELAPEASALTEPDSHNRGPIPAAAKIPEPADVVLLVTDEDCCPETLPLGPARIKAVVGLDPSPVYEGFSSEVVAFKKAGIADAVARAGRHFACPTIAFNGKTFEEQLRTAASDAGASVIATAFIPAGPLRDFMALSPDRFGPILQIRREWDEKFWPHASAGFFKLKEKIPAVLGSLTPHEAEIGDWTPDPHLERNGLPSVELFAYNRGDEE